MRPRRNYLKTCLRRTQARRRRAMARTLIRRRAHAAAAAVAAAAAASKRRSKHIINGKVSAKLEALKNLIPGSHNNGGSGDGDQAVKAENLFQKTAEYIIVLRTRVVILQRLIELYGSNCSESQDVNVL